MTCNKRPYRNWQSANSALKLIRWSSEGKAPLRSYYKCKLCGNWHLSKVVKTPENDEKHAKISREKWLEMEAEYWNKKLKR